MILVDVDEVKKELAKLQANLRSYIGKLGGLTPLAIDLEVSIAYQAIVLAATNEVEK